MSFIERYRHWYDYERAANASLLKMLASVPKERRGEPAFQKALQLAGHLAACRENWLDTMRAGGTQQVEWWPEDTDLETLPVRFRSMEDQWTQYLDSLTDETLVQDFDAPCGGGYRITWNTEGQIMQLLGHSHYHRGQIALLVDSLGGTTEDTDYVFWAIDQRPDRWREYAASV